MNASLTTIVRRSLAGECALSTGTPLLIAVSGGPDSMALLEVCARLAKRQPGLILFAHGVDHGLRREAASELDLAERCAGELGVPFDRTRVTVAPRGGNLQARARERRWEALVAVARSRGAAIATAHHADDRAETLLMRLLRGAGARGLGVLPPRAVAPSEDGGPPVTVVRPMLRARREDVMRHLERHRVPFARDPSNEDPRFLRTNVRRRVLPLLLELDPKVVEHLAFLADELAMEVQGGKSPEWARSLPRATQVALARLATSENDDARVWLPGGLVVSRDPRARRKDETTRQSTGKKRTNAQGRRLR